MLSSAFEREGHSAEAGRDRQGTDEGALEQVSPFPLGSIVPGVATGAHGFIRSILGTDLEPSNSMWPLPWPAAEPALCACHRDRPPFPVSGSPGIVWRLG